jgi:hypothetical protein
VRGRDDDVASTPVCASTITRFNDNPSRHRNQVAHHYCCTRSIIEHVAGENVVEYTRCRVRDNRQCDAKVD